MAFGKKKAVEPELDLKNQPVPEGSHLLEVDDLKMYFHTGDGVVKAVDGVTYTLDRGETLGVVGESGSGKSVTAMTIMGLIEMPPGKIEGGDVRYRGKSLLKMSEREMQQIRGNDIAMVFQDPMTSLNPIRTIGSQITEVIEKHQGISRGDAKKQAIELMERVGIQNAADRFDEYPFQYSGGMRQRIVIAIALSCHPKILICDEPTTALDVTIQAQIIALIRDLQKELKFTTIYITHDLGVVANVADRVGVMYGGQIIEYGNVEEVFFDPRHPYTWALLSSLPQLGIKGQELYYITGTPPSLYNQIKGDAFAPRNEHALKIDFEMEPPFFPVSETHYAKTWLLDPRAPKLEKPEIIQNLHEKIKKMTDKGGAFHVE